MNQKFKLQKVALTLSAIIATSLVPTQTRADIGTGWNRIAACPEGITQSEEPFYHRVQEGENLWIITRQHNEGKIVHYDKRGKQVHYPTSMAIANHLKPSDYIFPGQRLLVPWKKKIEYYCR